RVARVELVDRSLSATHVAREDAGPETELAVVGPPERLVEILHAHDGQQQAERLLAPHPGALRHVGHNGRLEVVATAELLARGSLATRDKSSTALQRVRELRLNFRPLFFGVQRAHLGARISSTAKFETFRARGDLADELIGHAVEHKYAFDCEARLAGVE